VGEAFRVGARCYRWRNWAPLPQPGSLDVNIEMRYKRGIGFHSCYRTKMGNQPEVPTVEISTPPPPSSINSEKESHSPIEALYSPSPEASQPPPGAGGDGDDAFANEPSIFDDPQFAKLYWPRKDYEGIRRFFPDFKWTVAEEKRLTPSI
jgi:hypothetical protein